MNVLRLALALIGTFLVGSLLGGAVGVWYAPEGAQKGVVKEDSTQMTWDELVASLPAVTTVRGQDSTQEECLPVPSTLVKEDRPAPDTVYQELFVAQGGLSSPAVDYGDRSGLTPFARSRYPFLYLPLKESGRPAIEHDGRSTTVRAYGQNGRGYEFEYTYRPPDVELWMEAYGLAAWTPPTVPTRFLAQGGARLGGTIRRGAVEIEPSLGAALTRIGPSATMTIAFRSDFLRF